MSPGTVLAMPPVAGRATASVARMYDYCLGGKDNYAADRDLADRVVAAAPVVERMVRLDRMLLHRSARFMAERAGLRQFLDIGCGLPGPDRLDLTVRRIDPACRVAHVDNDPMVLSHARALLAVDGGIDAVEADLRDPAALLANPDLRRVIDFSEPVGVLMTGVLHLITDAEDPEGIVGELVARLPRGSHVVISHAVRTPEMDEVSALHREAHLPFTPRTRARIAALGGVLEAVPPSPEMAFQGTAVPMEGAVPLAGLLGRRPG